MTKFEVAFFLRLFSYFLLTFDSFIVTLSNINITYGHSQPNTTPLNYLIIGIYIYIYIYNKNTPKTFENFEIPINILKLPKRILTLENDQYNPEAFKNYGDILKI